MTEFTTEVTDSLQRAGHAVGRNAPGQDDIIDAVHSAAVVGGALGVGVLTRLVRLARTRPTVAAAAAVLGLLGLAVALRRRKARRIDVSAEVAGTPEWAGTHQPEVREAVSV